MIKKISILVLVFICMQGVSQKLNSSPYSSLGIGDLVSERSVEEMSMGGVSTSGGDIFNFNLNNPASFSSLIFTTFTIAGENRAYSFKDVTNNDNSSNAFLSYVAIGIPIGPKGGFAFGLQPKSTTGYSIGNFISDGNNEPLETTLYEGNGGLNQVFLGGGYEIFKGFSLGIEGKYVFGNIENSIVNQKKDVQLATKYTSKSEIGGFTLEGGAIYHKKLKKNLFLNFGVKIGFESNLDSDGSEYLYSVNVGAVETPRDTILSKQTKGSYKTPLSTSLGFSMGKTNKWSAGIDYSFRDAIKQSGSLNDFNPNLAYQNASTVAVGGYFIPRYNSISSYWERVIYRWGFNVEQTGMMVNGQGGANKFTPIDKLGISFGVGLPVGAQLSRLNLGFEFGKRGTTDNGLVEEKFFNFRLGLTLSNKWFKPRRIN